MLIQAPHDRARTTDPTSGMWVRHPRLILLDATGSTAKLIPLAANNEEQEEAVIDPTDTGSANGRGPASRKESNNPWRTVGIVAAVLLGFYLTLKITASLIYRSEGYNPGDADCDDCGITTLLDNIGWLAGAVGGYLLLLLVVWWALGRRA